MRCCEHGQLYGRQLRSVTEIRGGDGLRSPGVQRTTCGTRGNRADPVTLSEWGVSRVHPDPLEFLNPLEKIPGAARD